jgi:hypothetical protein
VADPTPESEVPEGAAVFPLIPPELGVHPLLLATLHAIVFFEGSNVDVVNSAAAAEQLELIATCLQRLSGAELRRVREDIATLLGYAKHQKWPKASVQFLKSFFDEFGIGQNHEQ